MVPGEFRDFQFFLFKKYKKFKIGGILPNFYGWV